MSGKIVLDQIDAMLNKLIVNAEGSDTIDQLRAKRDDAPFGILFCRKKSLFLSVESAVEPVISYAVELDRILNGQKSTMYSYFNMKLRVEKEVRAKIKKIASSLPDNLEYLEQEILDIGEKSLEIMYQEWNKAIP